MRISRVLALAGIDSRRKCEEYVRRGDVEVNGEVIRDLGRRVDPEKDMIYFRGRPLVWEKRVYFLLHKPEGYTTTAADPHAKKTVYELLPFKLTPKGKGKMASRTRVFPVGRLDRNTSGLLLFTNDGDLANRLTHPRYQVPKWYEVRLDRPLDPRDRRRLLEGVPLEDGMARAEKMAASSKRVVRLLLREGRKREVRRMFEVLDYEVVKLCRIAFGPLMLGHMAPGEGRFLTPREVQTLRAQAPSG